MRSAYKGSTMIKTILSLRKQSLRKNRFYTTFLQRVKKSRHIFKCLGKLGILGKNIFFFKKSETNYFL